MILALTIACAKPVEEPFHPPDALGPYGVGATTIASAEGGAVEVWYPTDEHDEPTPYPEIAILGVAQRNATPRAGAWPVVAFSHGNGGIRFQSIFLTERLASFGFLVVAPDHLDNTMFDFDEDAAWTVANRRPLEVSAAVDAALAWADRSSETPFTVMGHSFGAWTSLVVGGGMLDWDELATTCASTSGYTFCGLLRGEDGEATPPSPDPRAVYTVALAPGGAYTFGADGAGLAGLGPTLLLGASLDDNTPVETELEPIFAALRDDRSKAILTGAGHYSFTDICSLYPVFDECDGAASGFMDIETAQALTAVLVTAAIEVEVLEDLRYEPWLDEDTLDEIGAIEIE